jgi:hypothetical protein
LFSFGPSFDIKMLGGDTAPVTFGLLRLSRKSKRITTFLSALEEKMIPGLQKPSIENAPPQTTEVSTVQRPATARYIEQFQGILLDADDKCYQDDLSENEIEEARIYLDEKLKSLATEIDGLEDADKYLANHLCNYARYYCGRALEDAIENSRSPTAKEFLCQKLRKTPLFQQRQAKQP